MTELPEPQVSTYMHRQLDGAPPSVSVARIADMMRRDTLGSVLVESVDPESDLGIWTHLRREDEVRNTCSIRIRVFLTRTAQESTEDRARRRLEEFEAQYTNARVPRRPKRTRFPGAKEAYALDLAGKLPKGGMVVQEEWKVFEHDNGRTYEVQVTTYAGAQREFKKEIRAFWKSIRIRGD